MPSAFVDPHVAEVNLTDESVTLAVEVVGLTIGNWAEVSGYVIQAGVVIPFSAVQQVLPPDPKDPPLPPGVSLVRVTLGPMPQLTLGNDVMVLIRVTEAQIWPTVLGYSNQPNSGFKGRWSAARGNPTGATGIDFSAWPRGQTGTAGQSASPATASIPPLSVTVAGVQITVPPVAPG